MSKIFMIYDIIMKMGMYIIIYLLVVIALILYESTAARLAFFSLIPYGRNIRRRLGINRPRTPEIVITFLLIIPLVLADSNNNCDGGCRCYFPDWLCESVVIGQIFGAIAGVIGFIAILIKMVRYLVGAAGQITGFFARMITLPVIQFIQIFPHLFRRRRGKSGTIMLFLK